jgi:hypothetical protein
MYRRRKMRSRPRRYVTKETSESIREIDARDVATFHPSAVSDQGKYKWAAWSTRVDTTTSEDY